jgi:hypothetical protein
MEMLCAWCGVPGRREVVHVARATLLARADKQWPSLETLAFRDAVCLCLLTTNGPFSCDCRNWPSTFVKPGTTSPTRSSPWRPCRPGLGGGIKSRHHRLVWSAFLQRWVPPFLLKKSPSPLSSLPPIPSSQSMSRVLAPSLPCASYFLDHCPLGLLTCQPPLFSLRLPTRRVGYFTARLTRETGASPPLPACNTGARAPPMVACAPRRSCTSLLVHRRRLYASLALVFVVPAPRRFCAWSLVHLVARVPRLVCLVACAPRRLCSWLVRLVNCALRRSCHCHSFRVPRRLPPRGTSSTSSLMYLRSCTSSPL